MREFADHKEFKYLTAMYEKHGPYFMMCVNHLMDIGYKEAAEITDESLTAMEQALKKKEEDEGITLIMSPEFQRWIVETARDIANEVSSVDLLRWVIAYRPYDVKGVKSKR